MIAVNRKDRDGGGGLCRTDESKRPGRTPALEDKEAPRIFLGTHRSLLAKLLQTAAPAPQSLSTTGNRYLPFLRSIRLSIMLDSDRNLEALHPAPTATVDPCPFRAYLLQPP